jgi:hypothetical protein
MRRVGCRSHAMPGVFQTVTKRAQDARLVVDQQNAGWVLRFFHDHFEHLVFRSPPIGGIDGKPSRYCRLHDRMRYFLASCNLALPAPRRKRLILDLEQVGTYPDKRFKTVIAYSIGPVPVAVDLRNPFSGNAFLGNHGENRQPG